MPWVGFERTIPAVERTKAIHALDRTATVIGTKSNNGENKSTRNFSDDGDCYCYH
jgi:hypothetical protein